LRWPGRLFYTSYNVVREALGTDVEITTGTQRLTNETRFTQRLTNETRVTCSAVKYSAVL